MSSVRTARLTSFAGYIASLIENEAPSAHGWSVSVGYSSKAPVVVQRGTAPAGATVNFAVRAYLLNAPPDVCRDVAQYCVGVLAGAPDRGLLSRAAEWLDQHRMDVW